MKHPAIAAVAMIILLMLSTAAAASPGKQDRFGCHRCTGNCTQYELVKNEYHCHGTAGASQGIQTAPRIYGTTAYRRVARIIDGDTLTVYIGGKQQPVRLLGIDAPERSPVEKAECYSTQATYHLNKLTANLFVKLDKDKLQPDKDKYGRLLRYVTLFNSGIVANEEMIKTGNAQAATFLTTKVEQYKKLESSSKGKKLGMWGACFNTPKNETLNRLFPLKGQKQGSRNLN